jgi:hypothetical protein
LKGGFGQAGQGAVRFGKAGRGAAGLGKARAPMAQKEGTMRTFQISIAGTMPLLMHADNIDWADQMDAWKNDPKNKKSSKAGDDRTPPWRWIGCLNTDSNIVTIPSEYIMRCIMEGAAQVMTGRKQETFKSRSQSGLICEDFHWPLIVNGQTIAIKEVGRMREVQSFAEHASRAQELGFSLFVKRAKIGQSKHIRVRPRFDAWSSEGKIVSTDEQITAKVMEQIFEMAGRFKGLGDWRPGCKTPGPFGTFTAEVRELK